MNSFLPGPCIAVLSCILGASGSSEVIAAELASGHLLLTSDFKLLRGQVTQIGPSTVAYRDADGKDVFLPAAQCLGIIEMGQGGSGRRDPAVLILADGQRIPGRPEMRQGHLLVYNPLLGGVRVDLEQVQGLSFRAGLEPPRAAELDVVLLSNGDRIEGVIDALGSDIVLGVQAGGSGEGDASQVRIPLERVDAIGLVTPPRRGTGCRVWLEDGTVADVERPIAEGDGLVHLRGFLDAAETRAQGLPLDYLRGIRFSEGLFVPLASLTPTRVNGPIERLAAPPPVVEDRSAPLELSALRLSGPIEVEWSLPAGMRRVVAGVRVPSAVQRWADLDLVILDGVGEVQRFHVNGASTGMTIDLPLRDGTLIVRLEEGARGPIGDTIILEMPVLGPAPDPSISEPSSRSLEAGDATVEFPTPAQP